MRKTTVQPENPIKLRKNLKVDLLDCEASHLLILSSEGKLFEHRIEFERDQSEPRLLQELGNNQIVQIACGDHHSMAVSKGGELFSWGQNERGQLGLGKWTPSIKEPQLVQALKGIPLAKIAAGAAHSMAVSLSGSVYSWGKNAFGQLGLGDTEDRNSPTYVNALEQKKMVFVCCGGEHTAVLSKDGLVCTFGAGSYGQLGHNSTRNELFPRLVAELFGAVVSQVACGRWHTLVYIPGLRKVYSFGAGADGQLGRGVECDRLIPLPVALNNKKFKQEGNVAKEVVKIIAGENQSIVLYLEEKNSYVSLTRTLATVEEEKVEKWVSYSASNCWQNIKRDIKLIFSSVNCVNGSFLDKSRDKHFRTSQEAPGIDMSAVLLFSEKIAVKSDVCKQVINSITKLMQSVTDCAASAEALRVFLVVPVILQKLDISSDLLLDQLARAILGLHQGHKKMLESLWCHLDEAFFKDLVNMFQRLSSARLSSVVERLTCGKVISQEHIWPVQILQILYEVNLRTGFRIQENNFYVPEVKKLWTVPNITVGQSCIVLVLGELTAFSCIFEMEDKIMVHDINCLFQHFAYNMQFVGMRNELHVRRQHLVNDTWRCIQNATLNQFRQRIKVHFDGEPGIDDGGLAQELFTVLTKQLCAPERQIFRHCEESHLIWFSSQVQEDVYFLIGTLFGMALYNMKIAAFPFPLALFKKLANIQPTLEDFKELFPTEGRNLQSILDEKYDSALESCYLDFTTMEKKGESTVLVELKENGADILVSMWNRKEYVDAYVNYIFNVSVEKQFEKFKLGFVRGCPTKWRIFLPVELQLILHGHTKYDWEQLEKNAVYFGYEKSDETIQNFWTVFHDLPEEKKKHFLAFLTGSTRIPVQGMESFTFTIEDSRKENPEMWYPVAHTCVRVLALPRYTNKDVLEEKLFTALEHYERFGLL
ncbi:E3 ISG15--protein ligase HERC5-like isoform X2 [Tiliqua scincoides]|uniref:E3 ISG15--protein ligase HERC5-like isoform X2 n=1 Tax=Tiliqua scincoides TaxID=71010 RepID=UPI0034624FB7